MCRADSKLELLHKLSIPILFDLTLDILWLYEDNHTSDTSNRRLRLGPMRKNQLSLSESCVPGQHHALFFIALVLIRAFRLHRCQIHFCAIEYNTIDEVRFIGQKLRIGDVKHLRLLSEVFCCNSAVVWEEER